MDCFVATDIENNINEKIAVAVSSDNVYAGVIGKGFPTNLSRNFIGVRNKITNKV